MSNRILKASPDQVRVNLDIDQTGLETYARTGDDLVINLSTGDQITVQDFYVPASDGSLHSIVYSNDMTVEGDPTAAAGLGTGFSEEGIAVAALGALGLAALAAGGGGGDDDDDDGGSEEAFNVNDDEDFVDTSTNSAEGNVLANDTGEGLVVTPDADTTELGGQFVLSENGDYVYTAPADSEGGVDEFTYTVTDENGETQTGTVQIYVPSSQDDNPSIVTNSDVVDIDKNNSSAVITPLDNDGDTDGDGVSDQNLIIMDAESADGQGEVEVSDDGQTVTYTPDDGAEPGVHVLTYTVQDQDTGETETQTIFVNVENKDPIDNGYEADVSPDSLDNAINADDLASDPDGDDSELTFTDVSAEHGTVTLSGDRKTVYYTPDPGYEGDDTLSYTVEDEHGATHESDVTVTVDPSLTADTEEQGFLDPLIGEDGLLGFVTADGAALGDITGSEGLLGELVGSSSPLSDLSNELLGQPLLGDGVGEGGEDGILDGLIGDDGLLGPVTGNEGLLGDITGSEGLLGDLLLTDGVLGAVSGHEGLVGELTGTGLLGETGDASDGNSDESPLDDLLDGLTEGLLDVGQGLLDPIIATEGLLGDLTGNGETLLGDITGSEGLLGDLVLNDGALGTLTGSEGLVGALTGTGLLGEPTESESDTSDSGSTLGLDLLDPVMDIVSDLTGGLLDDMA
ncbi:Ig-like domain-containing protein [Celeribacter sp.]|uniref:Ig-like domain-containing protein n=1 Tax=Celeribacter sp. TaxID=1890673 RepID=UPI003A9101B1